MNLLKVGVIGIGHMGRNHVRVFLEEKRFDFVGIYDIDSKTANAVAEKYNVRAFKSIEELLENVAAVTVAVPSSLHRDVALKIAEYGVHALVEKPLAITSEDAEIIVKTFRKNNLKLAAGHIERFNPVFRELQKLVKNEDIFFIEANRYSPFSGSGRITDTSVVEDLMIHDVDLVCTLMVCGGGAKN